MPGLMDTMIRSPVPSLRPFVARLWHAKGACANADDVAEHEHVLPTGTMHIAIRLDETPIRLSSADRLGWCDFGQAVIGGPRSGFYVKQRSRSPVVGAQLRPGAALALFGQAAHEFVEQHVALDAVWGDDVDCLRQRLVALKDPAARLALLEIFLAARLPRARALHPAIAQSLQQLAAGCAVGQIVEASGYSHRGFLRLFEESVGLTPKRYARVQRLQRCLARLSSPTGSGLIDIAIAAGYSDQAHFNREFREMTGLTPAQYRRLAPQVAHHVRIPAGD